MSDIINPPLEGDLPGGPCTYVTRAELENLLSLKEGVHTMEAMDLSGSIAATGTLTYYGGSTNSQTIYFGEFLPTLIYYPDEGFGAVTPHNIAIAGNSEKPLGEICLALQEFLAGSASTQPDFTFVRAWEDDVIVSNIAGSTMTITAKVAGAAGNAIATTQVGDLALWDAATLSGGVDVVACPALPAIPLEGYTINRNGDDLYACANIAGTVKTISLGTAT